MDGVRQIAHLPESPLTQNSSDEVTTLSVVEPPDANENINFFGSPPLKETKDEVSPDALINEHVQSVLALVA